MNFQFYPSWGFQLTKTVETYIDWSWFRYWLIIGPFQFNWRGKPWVSHLRRSPAYQQTIKKLLLEDLSAQKYTHTHP